MASKYVRSYLQQGLAATPLVIERLLAGVNAATLDWTPDPERFTLREAVAHMAEWEGIWLQRINLIQSQDNPVLVGYDEEQLAIDHDYAHSDFQEQLTKFKEGRAALTECLATLSEEQWAREGIREGQGPATAFDLAVLVLGHDGYHLRQVSDYLNTTGA